DRGPEPMPLAIAGTERMLKLLRDAGVVRPALRASAARQRALIAWSDRLVTAAAALEGAQHDPTAAERTPPQGAAARCARLGTALEEAPSVTLLSGGDVASAGPGSPLLPILVDLERALAGLEQTLADPATVQRPEGFEPERPGLFAADAFTNPEYVRYS